jgi:very-short-patch-repair endonuclease
MDELTRQDGIPVTNPARTLLDLAGIVGMRELERILARSERRGLLERGEVERLLLRYPGRRGIVQLRTLIDAETDPLHTRSEAEERFLTLVRKGALASPEMNVLVHGFEVDAIWRGERLIVEIDGFAFHSSPSAFERDRYRDGVLTAAGFRVMRVTWQQLTREPESLLVRLTKALVAHP